MKYRKSLGFIKRLYKKFIEDEIYDISAEVTYYLLLSFVPFLIFLITLISYTQVVQIESISLISTLIPANVYQFIVEVMQDVIKTRGTTILSFGMLATIWSASTGVKGFMRGFNRAYGISETRSYFRVRWISILFTLGLSMVLIFAFILLVLGEILGRHIFMQLGFSISFVNFWNIVRYLFALSTMLFIFVLLYYYTPNRRLLIKEVLPGALLSTGGWAVISSLFAFYVNNFSSYANTYGSLGTVVVLMLWLYWSSIIILAGNEINAFLIHKRKKQ